MSPQKSHFKISTLINHLQRKHKEKAEEEIKHRVKTLSQETLNRKAEKIVDQYTPNLKAYLIGAFSIGVIFGGLLVFSTGQLIDYFSPPTSRLSSAPTIAQTKVAEFTIEEIASPPQQSPVHAPKKTTVAKSPTVAAKGSKKLVGFKNVTPKNDVLKQENARQQKISKAMNENLPPEIMAEKYGHQMVMTVKQVKNGKTKNTQELAAPSWEQDSEKDSNKAQSNSPSKNQVDGNLPKPELSSLPWESETKKEKSQKVGKKTKKKKKSKKKPKPKYTKKQLNKLPPEIRAEMMR